MPEISPELLSSVIHPRQSDTHKGDYGRVLLIGGSDQYGGAIIMAAEAAINSGSGLVCVATHSINLGALHARLPEAMFIDWRDRNLGAMIGQVDVIVCGPGLGQSDQAIKLLQLLKVNLTGEQTVILDASALDLIAKNKELMPTRSKLIIMTPHQMEWQRLSQLRIPFQTDSANLAALKALVPGSKGVLVLKSNHTKVFDTDGNIYTNPLGNPGMATGGTGDTLAGIIGGFCAQFGGKVNSVLAAVYIHSWAGDLIGQDHYVVRPTQISALLPKLMKKVAEKL